MSDDEAPPPSPGSDHAIHLVTHTTPVEALLRETSRTLDDLRGIATVRERLHQLASDIRENATNHHAWLGGLLLYGPEGCGKVVAVEVLANELQAPLHVINMAAGWDRKAFAGTLQQAIDAEATLPLHAIHFENIDAPAAPALFADMLPILDAQTPSRRLLITASATEPWRVGTDVIRVGRLEHVLLVLPPDPPSREEFLTERLAGTVQVSKDDLEFIVERTEGHSFNDLQRLVDEALRLAKEAGTDVVDRTLLRHARRDVGPSSAQWLTDAGHHAIMNEETGMYDDLLLYFHMRQRT